MREFEIQFNPPIPPTALLYCREFYKKLDFGKIYLENSKEIDVIYCVNSHRFQYYPASISTILGDLIWEIDQIHRRESHLMTLSGYTVLEMQITGDEVTILDPVIGIINRGRDHIGTFSVVEIQRAFSDAVNRVLASLGEI